jgi:hypothetical protein
MAVGELVYYRANVMGFIENGRDQWSRKVKAGPVLSLSLS